MTRDQTKKFASTFKQIIFVQLLLPTSFNIGLSYFVLVGIAELIPSLWFGISLLYASLTCVVTATFHVLHYN